MQKNRFIRIPQRTSFAGTLMVLSVVAMVSLAFIRPGMCENWLPIGIAGLLSLAVICRSVYAIHITLFVMLLILLPALVPLFRIWPWDILAPLLSYGAVAGFIPQLRHTVGWIHRGDLNPAVIKSIIAAAFISTLGLIGWVMLTKPDIRHHLALIPELPLWTYPLAGIGFAFFNAAMEEAIFRGIVMEALDSALGAGYWSVGIQAVPFAALHYLAGFPNDTLGFIMTLAYGIMLGAIRRLSRGMLAPLVAHIAADMTIFSILIFIFFQ